VNDKPNNTRLAQSASALGAGILGFGLGTKYGNIIADFAFIIIIVGAIFHVWGMYVMQMGTGNEKGNSTATVLWISAWVCLIVLIAVIVYLLITKRQ
jgi:NADH:ubiquinone oxidoreductase subunit 6 (subunit J)